MVLRGIRELQALLEGAEEQMISRIHFRCPSHNYRGLFKEIEGKIEEIFD